MLSSKASVLSRASYLCLKRHTFIRASFSTCRVHLNTTPTTQHAPPHSPIGVSAALQAAADPSITPRPRIFEEFALTDRVCMVSGGHRGLGLEMALALCELGARVVYCFDLPEQPSDEWIKARQYIKAMTGGRLEYVRVDVRDQKAIRKRVGEIGDREGRVDVCVAAAGVARMAEDSLTYEEKKFKEVMDINTAGVLFTAQAAGKQMLRFGNAGSIILIASIAGHNSLKDSSVMVYNASKAAVHQLGRSMACELAPKGIRVNTISPGHMRSPMTAPFLEEPKFLERWKSMSVLGRMGRQDELRGAVAWLAGDASSFCTGSDIVVDGGHLAW